MEKRIKYGISLVLLLIVVLGLYGWLRHSSEDPLTNMKQADIHIAARDLVGSFTRDESSSDRDYLYKTLSVRGVIKEIKKNETGGWMVYLDGGPQPSTSVSCSLDSLYNHHDLKIGTGDSVIIRGVCAGRLIDVLLLQSIIEK